jgi:hemerythrin
MTVDTWSGVIEWSPKYELGVELVDGEHQQLFLLAGRMHQAMLEGKGKQVLQELLASLVDYTGHHFEHEEALMRRVGFPDFEAHREQHRDVSRKVLDLQARAEGGERTMTIEVMTLLMNWMGRHILEADQRIATYMVQSGVPPV